MLRDALARFDCIACRTLARKKTRFVRGESLGKGDVSALRVVRDKSNLIVLEEISSQWYDGKVPVGSWGPHKAVV